MSPIPALGVGLLALLGIVLVGAGIRAARRSRSARGPRLAALTATLLALGVASLFAAGSGFRHFGGYTHFEPEEPNEYVCDAWYAEIGSRAGRWEDGSGPAPLCKHAAEAAIPTVLGESLLAGGVAGVMGCGVVLAARRRRVDRTVERLIITSS